MMSSLDYWSQKLINEIGITGSLSSGKSSVAKMLSKNNNILFSADKIVQDLYKKKVLKYF